MKNFRRMRSIALLLAAFLLLALAGCGAAQSGSAASDSSSSAAPSAPVQSESEAAGAASQTAEDTSGHRVPIAYFAEAENSEVDAIASPSVVVMDGDTVGRMRALADMIRQETGGDLFAIETSVDYPADIGALIDYAAEEQSADARPELTSHIENLEDYDTIFVGYPNWWYDMPMVLYSFFEEYDFSGKTIIPFNSHNGSRFSDTINTIAGLEPDAMVITDGLTVHERNIADCAAEVATWLRGLGY